MDKFKKIFVLILFCMPVFYSFSQNTDTLSIYKYEQILSELFSNISKNSNDIEREGINNMIVDNMGQVLLIEGSFSYHFDSLKNVGKIVSPDNKLRSFVLKY